MQVPEEWTAWERDQQAAADKLPFPIWADLKSFSKSGQNAPSRTRTVSSSAWSVGGVARWLNTAPILKSLSLFQPDRNQCSKYWKLRNRLLILSSVYCMQRWHIINQQLTGLEISSSMIAKHHFKFLLRRHSRYISLTT